MAKKLKLGDFATDYAKTPGPARYEAVSADITQPRRPSYSMQARQYMPGGMGVCVCVCVCVCVDMIAIPTPPVLPLSMNKDHTH